MKLVFAPTTGSFLDSGDPFRESTSRAWQVPVCRKFKPEVNRGRAKRSISPLLGNCSKLLPADSGVDDELPSIIR